MDLQAAGLHPQLFQSLPLGLVLLDRQGFVAHVNPSAEAIIGKPPSETRWAQTVREQFQHKNNDSNEVFLRDGRSIHVSTCPLPNRSGQLVILQDMSATRQLQEVLGRQQRMASMGQMLAAMAHQIRTPLTTAMLHAGNLEWLQEDKLCAAGKNALTTLHQELVAIERKISDFLLFAKGGRILHDTICVNRLIHDLKQNCNNPNWQNLAIIWNTDQIQSSLFVLCNRNTLFSVFSNLLNNAKEAGASEVNLNCSCDEEWLTISLQDNGKGLLDSEIRQVMQPFYSTRPTGTGLGLPVVKLVIEAHNGTLSLSKGRELGGLNITVKLPLQSSLTKTSSREAA
ncbi:ATP-binding protein [Sansalvadorimonas sp. 2012CJ34-2]|uniref:histidine kinase n=1 Tax=Parendozoicomonas callyspongiae TaxID=2942213 RepID=A0ABT0PHA1_9GAMM|nr:ATP-binding protein [Sansalvadorimonas sp. 2012CJ34-2]MCL6270127.1 ATP-binding protein [Sansalvadorimonas sp. 2012CJ34-2]